jgi:hypothetical protein
VLFVCTGQDTRLVVDLMRASPAPTRRRGVAYGLRWGGAPDKAAGAEVVVADERRREGPTGDRAWAAAFDANLRALGEVQRRGLLAAGDLVERLVAAVDGDGEGRHGPDADERQQGDLEGVVDLWADLVKRSLRALTPVPGDGHPSTTTLDITDPSTAGTLRLAAEHAGAEVWLHNGTAEDLGRLALHHGELRSHDGTALAAALRFDPAELDSLPARSSRGVVATVELLDATAPPGTYRGVVQVEGLPDAWLPVEVVVSR